MEEAYNEVNENLKEEGGVQMIFARVKELHAFFSLEDKELDNLNDLFFACNKKAISLQGTFVIDEGGVPWRGKNTCSNEEKELLDEDVGNAFAPTRKEDRANTKYCPNKPETWSIWYNSMVGKMANGNPFSLRTLVRSENNKISNSQAFLRLVKDFSSEILKKILVIADSGFGFRETYTEFENMGGYSILSVSKKNVGKNKSHSKIKKLSHFQKTKDLSKLWTLYVQKMGQPFFLKEPVFFWD
jgi:hypothetical protein